MVGWCQITMTDKEKKAIEHLTKKMEYHKNNPLNTYVWLTLDEHYVRTILNLIEKQSKEIEELKNEVMEKELIIDGMKEDRRIAVEEIQEQYYISKDKIKAKIEELDYNDIGNFERRCKQEVLQSLLEKE